MKKDRGRRDSYNGRFDDRRNHYNLFVKENADRACVIKGGRLVVRTGGISEEFDLDLLDTFIGHMHGLDSLSLNARGVQVCADWSGEGLSKSCRPLYNLYVNGWRILRNEKPSNIKRKLIEYASIGWPKHSIFSFISRIRP